MSLGMASGGAAPQAEASAALGAPAPTAPSTARARSSDVEQAVLGHGQVEGRFEEGHQLRLERDPIDPPTGTTPQGDSFRTER